MPVLFTEQFDDHLIHVLEVRGRPAFLPRELAVAAGYGEDGQRFLDQVFQEWATGLDEDDDVGQLTTREFDALKRDLPGMTDRALGIVLFATGAERCLQRARVRRARELLTFVRDTVLPRFAELTGSVLPAEAPPPSRSTSLAAAMRGEPARVRTSALQDAVAKLKSLGVRVRKAESRAAGFRAIVEMAESLREEHVVTHEEWGALRVEAVEHLLGRGLRTRLGLADLLAGMPAAS